MFPVSDQPQRFGNAAYRSWFEKMSNESASMCEKILPEELKAAAVELSAYWSDSFGNKSRIDYGTGHEMNFFVFLFCVEKAYQLHKSAKSNSEGEQTKPEDDVLGAMITIVFTAYMDLVRKLQLTYRMEPAGYYFKNSPVLDNCFPSVSVAVFVTWLLKLIIFRVIRRDFRLPV